MRVCQALSASGLEVEPKIERMLFDLQKFHDSVIVSMNGITDSDKEMTAKFVLLLIVEKHKLVEDVAFDGIVNYDYS